MRVHFICRGNAYRSRMAEAYFRSLNTGIDVVSTGTDADNSRSYNVPSVTGGVDEFLVSHGINTKNKPDPVQFTKDSIQSGDHVIIFTQRACDEAVDIAGILPADTEVWEINDHDEVIAQNPMNAPDRNTYTEQIFPMIQAKVDDLVSRLTAQT